MNIKNVHWSAGLFEGEGSVFTTTQSSKKYSYIEAVVGMNDRHPVSKMYDIWGGTLYETQAGVWRWRLRWRSAREFLMTVYSLLSPRRQKQIKKALKEESKDRQN